MKIQTPRQVKTTNREAIAIKDRESPNYFQEKNPMQFGFFYH